MLERIRFFPIAIAILVVFLGLKTADVWTGVDTQISAISPAMASGDAPAEHAAPDHGAEPADDHGAADSHGEPEGNSSTATDTYMSAADVDIMNSMKDRDAKYEAWEDELKMRERMLSVAENKVEAKIGELRDLEATLRSLVEVQSEKEEADLLRLVKVYQSMKPQDAAPIIQRLDAETQLAIASRMKAKSLADIFAKMDDETPQNLTVRLMEQSEMPEELAPAE